MKGIGLSQMLVTESASVFYLTGKWIHPGERMLALYLSSSRPCCLVYNELFAFDEKLDVEKISYSDVQDGTAILASKIEKGTPLGIDKNWPAGFLLRLMELNPGASFVNASECVDHVRTVKDTGEIEIMRSSSRINDACMAEFCSGLNDGISEEEAASGYLGIYRAHGASGFSFSPLVAFGANSADAHHSPNNTRLKAGCCVLIDVGCVLNSYCSDMTRTFFYRHVSPEQRKVYETVLRANEAAEAIVRPDVRFCDVDRAARSIIEEAGWGRNFTHRLGHSIGIRDHECDDVSSNNERRLVPGMTFSIEPGIYLPGFVGVRIEDLVTVTDRGCEILNSYPKELKVLE